MSNNAAFFSFNFPRQTRTDMGRGYALSCKNSWTSLEHLCIFKVHCCAPKYHIFVEFLRVYLFVVLVVLVL